MVHHIGMGRYFLRNDFIFPLKYIERKYKECNGTSTIQMVYRHNPVSNLGKYLYQLNKLTNITKVHVIGYGVDIIELIPILDFYANIIYDYCNKRLILHIDTIQATSLKKAAIENPGLRKYDAIQFQSDPDGVKFINGADQYHFRRDCDNVAEYFH